MKRRAKLTAGIRRINSSNKTIRMDISVVYARRESCKSTADSLEFYSIAIEMTGKTISPLDRVLK